MLNKTFHSLASIHTFFSEQRFRYFGSRYCYHVVALPVHSLQSSRSSGWKYLSSELDYALISAQINELSTSHLNALHIHTARISTNIFLSQEFSQTTSVTFSVNVLQPCTLKLARNEKSIQTQYYAFPAVSIHCQKSWLFGPNELQRRILVNLPRLDLGGKALHSWDLELLYYPKCSN